MSDRLLLVVNPFNSSALLKLGGVQKFFKRCCPTMMCLTSTATLSLVSQVILDHIRIGVTIAKTGGTMRNFGENAAMLLTPSLT